jgi:Skp family chaperone for outer membrane proteins
VKIPRVSIRLSAVLAVTSLTVATALFLARQAMAQGAPNAQNIAVIDIGKILKADEKFKRQMADLQAEVAATENQLRADAKVVEGLVQQQKTFAPGTPDYTRLDAEITQRSADLQVKKNLKNKELVERQSKMLLGAYLEVQDAVREFSKRYNIGLVIQYDSAEINPADPQAILSGAHRQIVFVNPGLDITQDILTMLNRGQRVSTNPGGGQQGVVVPH